MQKFRADLHIHSRFSRATSKKLTLRLLSAWAKVKGISVLGTGDFTHPQWRAEMYEQLVFEESSGLYALHQEVSTEEAIPGLVMEAKNPRFMLQGEISSIYKRGGQVRKVHNLVFMPDLETAEKFCQRLEQIGNLKSDGRPILGLDSRDLLEIVLETHEKAFLVPAHIWTPWFSVFGSKSGFNDIKDCFGDLTQHIFALETGLSSNQAMNRLCSSLDSFRLLSNSDAHSGENLGREINLFSGTISYDGILKAVKEPHIPCDTMFEGTLEFYPEEGKYHGDGHRNCNVSLSPKETRECKGICPVCGQPLTIGVLYRVMELADRDAPLFPDERRAKPVVPLVEILSEIVGVGAKSRKVQDLYVSVLDRFGAELDIVTEVPLVEINAYNASLGEAIQRMRQGNVHITSGFDGEYGVIRMFSDEERRDILANGFSSKGKRSQHLLLLDSNTIPQSKSQKKSMKKKVDTNEITFAETSEKSNGTVNLEKENISLDNTKYGVEVENTEPSFLEQENTGIHLNSDQEQASMAGPNPVLVLAGPGTGKTSTLIGRIAWLLREGIPPRRILAVTFTRKAATEIDQRLTELLPDSALPQSDTLHALALDLWHKAHADVPVLLSEESAKLVFAEANPDEDAQTIKNAWRSINIAREKLSSTPEEYVTIAANYAAHKSAWNLADYTDLLEFWLERTASGLDKGKWDQILVDEIQDLSALQLALVCSLLPEGGEGFFGIGDPDQSIYGFRGATGRSLEVFKAYWPALEVISLTKNYRSFPEIIEVATSLQEGHSASGGLEPMSKGKGFIHLFHAPTVEAETRWITDRVAYLLGSSSHTLLDSGAGKTNNALPQGTYAPGDIAILVRTHALGHAIRKSLARIGLPVSEPQTDAFWEDPRVALVLRSVGRMYGISLAYGGNDQASLDCPDKILAKGPLGLAAYFSTIPPFEEHFWQTKSFKTLVKAYDSTGGWAELITWINLQNELELVKGKAQKIQILSIHAAKGLEFPVVFLPCMEDGILPFAGQDLLTGHLEKNQGFDLEEERRLLYVGVTRAKEALFLTYAGKRMLFGKELRLKPSRFLEALPKEITTASALVEKSSISAQQLSLID